MFIGVYLIMVSIVFLIFLLVASSKDYNKKEEKIRDCQKKIDKYEKGAGGLDEGLSIKTYRSPLGKDAQHWVGLEIERNGVQPIELYAELIDINIEFEGNLQPYQKIIDNNPIFTWSAKDRVTNNGTMLFNRGDSKYFVKVAEIKDYFSLTFHKENRRIETSLSYIIKIRIGSIVKERKSIKPIEFVGRLKFYGRGNLVLEEIRSE